MYGKYAFTGHIEDLPLESEAPRRPAPSTGGSGGGRAAVANEPGLAILNKMPIGGIVPKFKSMLPESQR